MNEPGLFVVRDLRKTQIHGLVNTELLKLTVAVNILISKLLGVG